MISINNLTVAYGGFTLLNEINFHISESDKIGLVGKNGAGKSTILKLICGFQSPTAGKVAVPNGVKIGYLPQIMEHHRGRSVIDEAMTAFADMFALEDELEKITVELSERDDYESEAYHDLIVRIILLVHSQRDAVGGGGHLHGGVGDAAVVLAVVGGHDKQAVGKLIHCLVIHSKLLACKIFRFYYKTFFPDLQVFIDTYFDVW